MKKRTQTLLLATLLAAAVTGTQNIYAEDAEGSNRDIGYSLDPVLVTATRYNKKDLEIAASTQTYTAKEIEQTGADNMFSALQYLDGVIQSGMGPNGASVSSMTSKIMMRGVEDGTVVMLNGTPINWRNLYNLESIPTEAVERVEVVRGGASVMHGSQTTGGVINIITKKVMPNQVQVGLGKFGRQDYKVSVGAGKFSFAYHYNKWGETGIASDYDTTFTNADKKKVPVHMQQNFMGSEKNDFLATYKINDKIDLLYNHNQTIFNWSYRYAGITTDGYTDLNGQARYNRTYTRDKDFIQLNFKDLAGISGHVFFNQNKLKAENTDFYKSNGTKYATPQGGGSDEDNRTYGFDVQKIWNRSKKHTFLLGGSLVRETWEYDEIGKKTQNESRNVASLFASWDGKLTKRDNLSVGVRGTWTYAADQNFHNMSAQAQYLHKLTDTQSVYASVVQSFVLPTLKQMYGRANDIGETAGIVGDPNLKPQKGTHYELGWKMETANRQYKVALFSERIKDNITFVNGGNDNYYATNEHFRNQGLELSVRGKQRGGFSWHAGLTLQDPESKPNTSNPNVKKPYWDRSLGRFLLNGGIAYEKGKWSTALNFTYLADRVMTPSSAHSYDQKPYLLTTFSAKYSPNAESDILLTIDNVLDRQDVTSHTSSDYYATPFNYLLSYRYKF